MSARAAGEGEAGGFADLTFEQLVEALEGITTRMASGQIGIEEVASLYEQASRLHAAASQRLDAVRQRLEDLTGPGSPAEA